MVGVGGVGVGGGVWTSVSSENIAFITFTSREIRTTVAHVSAKRDKR